MLCNKPALKMNQHSTFFIGILRRFSNKNYFKNLLDFRSKIDKAQKMLHFVQTIGVTHIVISLSPFPQILVYCRICCIKKKTKILYWSFEHRVTHVI